MKKITNVRSTECPPEIRILGDTVIVISNIKTYTEQIEEHIMSGYEYDCTIYSKDQYIVIMAQQTKAIEELQDQLEAAKILLGVD